MADEPVLPVEAKPEQEWPAGVWRADAGLRTWGLAAPFCQVTTGHPSLDACLAGHAWPAGLSECLSARPGTLEWSLLIPWWRHAFLEGGADTDSRWVAWVVPDRFPSEPYAPGWQQWGLPSDRCLWVRPRTTAEASWSIERMLHHQAVHSIVWVLNDATTVQLRRVQWAAQQAGIPVFACRPAQARHDASPAPLRLWLEQPAEDHLRVTLLKQPGPLPARPLELPLLAARPTGLESWRGVERHHRQRRLQALR
jgi:protein ImuA